MKSYEQTIYKILTGQPTTDSEQVEEASKGESEAEFQARQQRLAASNKETQKNPDRLARMMKIPGYADAMKLAQKTTQKEVEEIDEISKEKTQKYLDRALDSHSDLNMARRNTSGDAQKEFARKEKLRKQGISRAVDRLTKEEVELVERTYNDDDLYSIHKDTGEVNHLGNPYKDHSPNMKKRELEAAGHKVVVS